MKSYYINFKYQPSNYYTQAYHLNVVRLDSVILGGVCGVMCGVRCGVVCGVSCGVL